MTIGETNARPELSGLRGIPETVLSQALLAGLPANEAEAPWECHCAGLLWLGRGGRAAAAALPPALTGSSALATIGGFVRYTDTPVGPYDEVLGMVASHSGLRPWGNVAFMSVDSPPSLVGGRTNWAMPKTLARFDGDLASGHTITGRGSDGVADNVDDTVGWSISATPRVIGPAIPIKAKSTARQQFSDGRIGDSLLVCSGRIRPAVISVEVSSAGTLGTWLRPGRHLGAFVESATFTLGEPQLR